MYVIRDETGKAFTWCTDKRRADLIAGPSYNMRMRLDRGAQHYWWFLPRLKLGEVHPYDLEARAHLQARFEELRAAWLAGCNDY
jgi:hypothetical protein